jgi:hypothetical protein
MRLVEIKFRVPEGEEMSDERLLTFEDLGFPEEDIYSDIPGEIWVACRFPVEASDGEIEASVEEIGEDILNSIGDMEMCDYEFRDRSI